MVSNLFMFYISTTLYFKQYLINLLYNYCPFFVCAIPKTQTTLLILQFINISVEASLHKIDAMLFTVCKDCAKTTNVFSYNYSCFILPDRELINMQLIPL